VATAIPAPLRFVAGHAKICFVDERRRLQGLVRLALAGETRLRESPEFVIDFRQHLTRGAGTAVRVGVRGHQEREL
jgi:hypothetical protein